MSEATDPRAVRMIVRPKAVLNTLGVLTFLITIVPLFGVLYWYTEPFGIWQELLFLQLLILAACIGAFWRQSRVFSSVSSVTLQGNGIFSRTEVVPLDDVARVVLVPVYRSHPSEATTQLIVMDHTSQCVFRMRGQFWHPSDMTGFAQAIGPVTTETVPLSEEEFFEEYPCSAYWFEKSAGLRLVVLLGAVAVVVGLIFTIMSTIERSS